MVKRFLLVLTSAVLLLSIVVAGVWLWGQATSPARAQTTNQATDYSPAQTITVVGQGSVKIKPDIAQVSLGVETSAETVKEAVTENEAKMTSILAALTALGVAEKDVQTTQYSVQLDRGSEPVPQAIGTGSTEAAPVYRVSNMVNVTVRDLDKVSDVLDAVIEAGANNLWGISFSLDDPSAAQADARSEAITDAQARATALAELSGLKLGPVMSVSEVINGGSFPMGVTYERAAVAGAGPISPGELEIGYQVQVIYFIEP
jgi:uncharacterized protein YggE